MEHGLGDFKYGLVLANDIIDEEKSLKLSEETAPYTDATKLGITAVMRPGTTIIRKTKNITGKIIIADFKVADIGHRNKENKWEGTNNKIVGELVSAGADYVICHTIIGTSSIQECVDTAHAQGGKILTLPYMTHKGAGLFFDLPVPVDDPEYKKMLIDSGLENVWEELDTLRLEKPLDIKKAARYHEEMGHNWRLPYVSVSDAIILIGEEIGVDGYIGPANNPAVLKDYRMLSEIRNVLTPGIGRQSSKPEEEQFKDVFGILGPTSAAIIGSTIYKAEKPAEAAANYRAMRDRVAKALDEISEGC